MDKKRKRRDFGNLWDERKVDREVIEEILCGSMYTTRRNEGDMWRQEDNEVDMEVVEHIIEEKDGRIVKFAEDEKKKKKFCTRNSNFIGIGKGNYTKISKNSTVLKKDSRMSNLQNRNFDEILRSRVKHAQNDIIMKCKDDTFEDDKASRPGSVSSQYTACSNAFNLFQMWDFTDKLVFGNLRETSNRTVNILSNRMIVEEINENLNEPSLDYYHQNKSNKLDIIPTDNLSLVSEIQSISTENQNMSIDNECETKQVIRHKEPKFTRIFFKKQLSCMPSKKIHRNQSRNNQQSSKINKREFRCFKDSDIIDFHNVPTPNIQHDLEKGDEDEDTDEEDHACTTKYNLSELNKALREHLKPSLG